MLRCLNDEAERRQKAVFPDHTIHTDENLFLSQLQERSTLAIVVWIVRCDVLLVLIHEEETRHCVALLVVSLQVAHLLVVAPATQADCRNFGVVET